MAAHPGNGFDQSPTHFVGEKDQGLAVHRAQVLGTAQLVEQGKFGHGLLAYTLPGKANVPAQRSAHATGIDFNRPTAPRVPCVSRLFRFGAAFQHQTSRFRVDLVPERQRVAQMPCVAVVRPGSRAQFRLVEEFVCGRGVFEGELTPEQ